MLFDWRIVLHLKSRIGDVHLLLSILLQGWNGLPVDHSLKRCIVSSPFNGDVQRIYRPCGLDHRKMRKIDLFRKEIMKSRRRKRRRRRRMKRIMKRRIMKRRKEVDV